MHKFIATAAQAYIAAAYFTDTGDAPADATMSDLATMTAYADVAAFVLELEKLGLRSQYLAIGGNAEKLGHDFWLTRNGHGAGFWDRGHGALGDELTKAAKAYGSSDLYQGDDGLLFLD